MGNIKFVEIKSLEYGSDGAKVIIGITEDGKTFAFGYWGRDILNWKEIDFYNN
jgi:hypothetical protein